MPSHIYLSAPHMSDEGYELEYIHDAFQKNWISPLGENVNEFEKAVKAYLGTDYVVALSSGTAAIHMALIMAGVQPGDRVFCQDLTFAASANPITYLGAEPVFIDSEYETWNMDPRALEKAIGLYGAPKAVIAVHLYGNPAKMKEICKICAAYNIALIEDSAEALGSEYDGRKCGTFGQYGILSFNGNKIITTSGGGMLLCKTEADAKHTLKLATQARDPFPWYEHTEVGFNYRLSNICAGIGRGQMKVLPDRVRRKQTIYRRYQSALADLPVSLQPVLDNAVSNHWLTSLLIDEDCPVTPMDLLNALKAADIEGRHVWKPMHCQPIYQKYGFVSVSDTPVSEDLFHRGFCLPSDSKMTEADVDRVSDVIAGCIKGAL